MSPGLWGIRNSFIPRYPSLNSFTSSVLTLPSEPRRKKYQSHPRSLLEGDGDDPEKLFRTIIIIILQNLVRGNGGKKLNSSATENTFPVPGRKSEECH
jgi:hypothetical protein